VEDWQTFSFKKHNPKKLNCTDTKETPRRHDEGAEKKHRPRPLFRTEGKGGMRGTRTIGMAPRVNDKRGIVTLDCVYG
jgi:hypothetical protein